MSQSYNIFFIGEVLEGEDEPAVRARLARLFNASDATLDKLFSGSPQLVKRGCDHGTALKYKQAMERAGARPRIRRSEDGPPAGPAAAPAPASTPGTTAAERVAALVGSADAADSEAPGAPGQAATEGLAMAPAGSEVLQPHERRRHQPVEVVTAALSLAEPGPLPPSPGTAAPAPPSTSHLSLEETGELIPNLPRLQQTPAPDTGTIALCDDGYDLSDCAPPPAPPPALDLSELALSPEGSPVLESRYRPVDTAAAPDTGHISLVDRPDPDNR